MAGTIDVRYEIETEGDYGTSYKDYDAAIAAAKLLKNKYDRVAIVKRTTTVIVEPVYFKE